MQMFTFLNHNISLLLFCMISELEIKDTTESTTSASYLDLLLSIGRDGQLHTSIYDKRDDFNFHITNFPFLSSNIPSSPAYGVFISQLIRYARACSSYECFILRARRLSSKLLKQGYLVERLKSSFRKFYGRYGDLIQQYEVSLSRMLNDILTLDQQWLPNQSDFPPISWPWYRLWPSPNYEWFPWSICNGCGMPAGNAYPSGHLVPSPILGLANKFLELAMSLLDFSPRTPLGTFSILLATCATDKANVTNITWQNLHNWRLYMHLLKFFHSILNLGFKFSFLETMKSIIREHRYFDFFFLILVLSR